MFVSVKNACQNNLKNASVDIKYGQITAFAGVSGSGKSTMAFDVIYSYWKGEKPAVESITGLPRKVAAINQRVDSAAERMRLFEKAVAGLPPKSMLIFDEPCAGLTKHDADAISAKLKLLSKDGGHAVLVVDHRPELLCIADVVHIFGPNSGSNGGRIVKTVTGSQYKAGLRPILSDRKSNKPNHKIVIDYDEFAGVKGLELSFPLHCLACVSGNIGTGKTTFVNAAFAGLDKSVCAGERRRGLRSVKGKQYIRRPHIITSAPVSKNSRSTVATYYGVSPYLKNRRNDVTVDDAAQLYGGDKLLMRRLEWLRHIGLGYLRLDQKSFTLSGGECQRIKVAKMLCKKLGDRSVYMFDNPCRGLGVDNIPKIMMAMDSLVKANNTVLIAENDPIAVQYADVVINLG